jgi:hypothetical protein
VLTMVNLDTYRKKPRTHCTYIVDVDFDGGLVR